MLLFVAAAAWAWNPIFECSPEPNHWESLPTEWKLQRGASEAAFYARLADPLVLGVLQASWNAWEDPVTCSTSFHATYGGPTEVSALAANPEQVVEFIEDDWPSSFGDPQSTIGVTLVEVESD